jgi:threonylcarbamoyladenosine tRNA methylthiotransferase MtaB
MSSFSLQSGCDETLKRMNRRYTTQQFRNIVECLRKYYEDVILTTDIIVGFPGETEEEFNETYEFLKEIKFYKMHIFKYSPRKGTKAAQMKQQIDGAKKEERSHKLIELSDENEKSYNKKYVGKTVEVLFEEKKDNYYKGHTKNYLLAYLAEENVKDIKIENQIIKVKCIEGTKEHILVEM